MFALQTITKIIMISKNIKTTINIVIFTPTLKKINKSFSLKPQHEADCSLSYFGFFHMYDLGISYTFHFRKKNYGIIRNIFMEWCFDP